MKIGLRLSTSLPKRYQLTSLEDEIVAPLNQSRRTMASIFPKVYGVPLSQPFRSVVWLLLQRNVPFQVKLTVPGATTKIGSQHDSYIKKTGVTTVPVLQTDETTYIPESPAILKHLCETHGWDDLYPKQPAMVDAYMHWHHSHTRHLSKLIRPFLRPEYPEPTVQDQERAHEIFTSIHDFWLGDAEWIAARHTQHPTMTIADILAYEEMVQLTMTGLITEMDEDYPAIFDWMERMGQVKHHDAIHACIAELGTLEKGKDVSKLLGVATKVGLKAIQDAQDSYGSSSSKL